METKILLNISLCSGFLPDGTVALPASVFDLF